MGTVLSCSLCCERGDKIGSSDNPYPLVAQLNCQCWQSIVLTLCPAVFECDTASVVNAGFKQTLAECRH
jgi:hypothetical protein